LQFTASIISRSATKIKGIAKVISIHEFVINLQFAGGLLLCLHSSRLPLSPMGLWLFHQDFLQIKQLIKLGQHLECDGFCLSNKTFVLQIFSREINLNLPNLKFDNRTGLNIISNLAKKTGLYGGLNEALSNLEREEFKPYYIFINKIITKQMQIPISHLLGKGLGLTPSSDDTLIGILAVLYSNSDIYQYLYETKPFDIYDPFELNKCTTLVSANYVSQALFGNFATPLWHFMVQFNQSNKFFQRLRDLLNCGHSSGADTLLGIFLALNVLNKQNII